MKTNMTSLLDSMEETIKLQSRAKAEQRARKAQQQEEDFREKLMRTAISKMELDGEATKLKGAKDAVLRDQFMSLFLAGF